MAWIVIPRWEDFQHYKTGRGDPTWIKLYVRLLDDEAYLSLSGHQRGVLAGIWMAYARSRRQLNAATLSRRLGVRVTRATLDALNDAGFIELSASKPLYQKREEEKREEEKREEEKREDIRF